MYNDMARIAELCKELHVEPISNSHPFVFECEPNRRTVCVLEKFDTTVLKTAVIVFYDIDPETDWLLSVIHIKLKFKDQVNEYKTHFPDILTKVKITTTYDYKTLKERMCEGNPLLDGLCNIVLDVKLNRDLKITYKHKTVSDFINNFKDIRWKEVFISTYDKRREK